MSEVNVWAEPRDAEEVDERVVKMKADLISELVAVRVYHFTSHVHALSYISGLHHAE